MKCNSYLFFQHLNSFPGGFPVIPHFKKLLALYKAEDLRFLLFNESVDLILQFLIGMVGLVYLVKKFLGLTLELLNFREINPG